MTLNRIFIRRLARSAGAFTTDYCKRHKHPVNAALHIVGVPAVVVGLFQLFGGRGPRFKFFGAFLVVFGYILQFLGHKQQGNEVGEVTLIKSLVAKLQAASARNLQRGTAYGAADAWGKPSSPDGREPAHAQAQPSGHKNGHNGHNGHKGNGDKRGGGRYILWWKTSH